MSLTITLWKEQPQRGKARVTRWYARCRGRVFSGRSAAEAAGLAVCSECPPGTGPWAVKLDAVSDRPSDLAGGVAVVEHATGLPSALQAKGGAA